MAAQNYKPHTVALAAAFTLGNAAILTPTFSVINITILLVSSFVFLWLGCLLRENKRPNKVAIFGTNAVVLLVALYGAATVILDYLTFLKAEQLRQTNLALVFVGFGAVLLAFSASKTHAIYKYCLFIFIIISLILLLCFISGINNFDFKNLNHNLLESEFSAKSVLRFCLPIVAIPFFLTDESNSKKSLLLGVSAGVFLTFTVMLQITLTLSNTGVAYPYLKAVSTISVGSLFIRLDGLVYVLFFATALIKSVVCIKVATNALRSLKMLF